MSCASKLKQGWALKSLVKCSENSAPTNCDQSCISA